MRVWDQIPPEKLCRNHLLAEHRETLAIWSILTNDKKGYRNHPEVKRWKEHLGSLYLRHIDILRESVKRNYNFKNIPDSEHTSKLCDWPATSEIWDSPEPWDDQLQTLKLKGCECKV